MGSLIRTQLFESEMSNSNLSKKHGRSSITDASYQLLEILLTGNTWQNKLNKDITSNVAQIIKLNAVHSSFLKTVQRVRHSKNNEPPLSVGICLSTMQEQDNRRLMKIYLRRIFVLNITEVWKLKQIVLGNFVIKIQQKYLQI